MRMSHVLAVQPEPSARFQNTEYFCKRTGFVLNPMKDAIQINNVEARVAKFRQIFGATDTRFKIFNGF